MILRGTVRAAYEELGLPSDDATIDKVWQEIVAGAAGRAETIHTMLSQQVDREVSTGRHAADSISSDALDALLFAPSESISGGNHGI